MFIVIQLISYLKINTIVGQFMETLKASSILFSELQTGFDSSPLLETVVTTSK